MNLTSLLDESAERYAHNIAVIDGENEYSYLELSCRASAIAFGLTRAGVSPGDVVALSSPNCIEFIAAFFGILKAGATVLPLSILLREEEIAAQLRFTGAKAYLCHGGTPELGLGEAGQMACARTGACKLFSLLTDIPGGEAAGLPALTADAPDEFPAVPRSAEDIAIISFTSGTTSSPKAACITHGAELAATQASIALFGYAKTERVLTFIPLFTSIAQALIQEPVLATGGCMVLQSRFDAAASLALIARHKVTMVVGVPTVYYRFCEKVDAGMAVAGLKDHWRTAIYGGSSMASELQERFEAQFGVKIRQAYGLTETRAVAGSPPGDVQALVPAPGTTFRVVDEHMQQVPGGEKGELVLQSPTTMQGYLNNLEKNEEVFADGWFRTGDLVTRNGKGHYHIVGRIKEIVSRASFKIYPTEVEAVMRCCPGIQDVAVFGVPHDELGEELAVAVVLASGAALAEAEIMDWGKRHLPPYGYPRLVKTVPALPMTATGKVRKPELVRLFLANESFQ